MFARVDAAVATRGNIALQKGISDEGRETRAGMIHASTISGPPNFKVLVKRLAMERKGGIHAPYIEEKQDPA